ncbi:hypothetical protein DN068_18995 [Taibaiella soli]|uniref:Uncharacterized protein n=1 Tax=Taibaiella soli TaxID=1649169 RepID=A0A2W2B5B6_9BACT|nr:hypothetical protein DN068_18995 [Taibaiella soli]
MWNNHCVQSPFCYLSAIWILLLQCATQLRPDRSGAAGGKGFNKMALSDRHQGHFTNKDWLAVR